MAEEMTMLLDVRNNVTTIEVPGSIVRVVNGVSFHIAAGECLGLVGESGCAKSMTAMSVVGLLPEGGRISSGEVLLEGQSLTAMEPEAARRFRAERIGVIFQNPLTALNPRMDIGTQLREAMPPGQHGSSANRRAAELLDMVGVPRPWDRLTDFPHELSGGLAQRVMIAMSLARNPRLLVADEPTTALDVSIQAQILDLIDELRRSLNLGVLLVTHDIGVVAERTQRMAVMYAGNIVEEGETALVLSRPIHPYTRGLLDSVPRGAASSQLLQPIEGAPPSMVNPPPGCRFAPRCARRTDLCMQAMPPEATAAAGRRYRCYHPLDGAGQAAGDAADAMPAQHRASRPPLVEIVDVSRQFVLRRHPLTFRPLRARHALSDVSLDVRPGESLGVVGESGCGKSTLARLVAGLDRATEGRILYSGRDITKPGDGFRQWRRDVQLIFQDPFSSLDPRMTVAEIIDEPMIYARIPDNQRRERIRSLIGEVGLAETVIDQRPSQLSGGQRQRIGIARALALDPKLIVADESVSALDVSVQATILNLFKKLQRERGLTYMFISHDLNVVRYMCDRVAVMYLGKVVEVGPTEDVFANPRHPYTQALRASMPGAAGANRLQGELPSAEQPPPGCRFQTRCPRVRPLCSEREPLLVPGAVRSAACHFPVESSSPIAELHV
jgi:peptide/nickel transport system ATP-binding protein